MLRLSKEEVLKRFDPKSQCRVSYKNQKGHQKKVLKDVDLSKVAALTILFPEEEKVYVMLNGDACTRDGVRVVLTN